MIAECDSYPHVLYITQTIRKKEWNMRQQCLGKVMVCVVIVLLLVCGGGQRGLAEEQKMGYVANTQVNLRAQPTTTADNILATVPQDTPVVILARQGQWYQVRLPDGREGWMSKWVLTLRETPPTESRGRGLVQPEQPETLEAGGAPTLPADTMIFIPGGTAVIGSDESEIALVEQTWGVSREVLTDELPSRMVQVAGFYLDPYEVTNAQYKEFVDATNYPPPLHWEGGLYPADSEDHPVTFVSWDDAQAYAQWAGKRLPTAEEWEVAARGLQGQMFPWGVTVEGQEVAIKTPDGGPVPVGSFPDDVSPYQIYDLGGNVMEWTQSQYEDTAGYFVLKGSSWNGEVFEARGANQTPGAAAYRLSDIGFRCARSE
ncbi:SUMF1/EgtB/PvdO family nonheme iron enzyme [candidate division KSB3 bacterium]|uniref:SUMF1/EgtB/PvdO family nonheme iron enzyme n=1 Tax=candidate division KSB3 bacterium TaxID=2044937 RepID=A0A9D5Q844_9BACT|nr:SUMF1/EgtB/PvdO family nonheme iron enzyme [candidate division KSB3 bacterium]MBD3327600.1 SUMF1/EgtB/PvdO family nonheme iron enzyme [candidate division KSB3 bacterium]